MPSYSLSEIMSKHKNILKFIRLVRDSHPSIIEVYTQGSCLWFYRILRQVYPNAVPYTNGDHIVTKIDNRLYDITGEVKGDYIPFDCKHYKPKLWKSCKELLDVG